MAVSPSTVAAMRERLGWTGDIYLIPNGTARPVTAAVARAGAKNLVWVGRLVAHKRAELLVAVAERLRQRRRGTARSSTWWARARPRRSSPPR